MPTYVCSVPPKFLSDDQKNKIAYIFYEDLSDLQTERVVIHELIHAFDHCKGLFDVKAAEPAAAA